MTGGFAGVLIPYSRFLEYQERQRTIAAEMTRRLRPQPLDASETGAPADTASAQPLTGAETS